MPTAAELGGTFAVDLSPYVANPACVTVTGTGASAVSQLNLTTAGCYRRGWGLGGR